MDNLRVLVAAAGLGTRAGLPYPKTLFEVQGKPILVRILELLMSYDSVPVVVASREGRPFIEKCLSDAKISAELVLQDVPRGMGDAVLQFEAVHSAASVEHLLLIWGDIPFIQPETVDVVVKTHFAKKNDFTFPTRVVDSAYTIVSRNDTGRVVDVVETRELGFSKPERGEREIGLFIFRRSLVLDALHEELPGKWGLSTSEHGFLYIIGHLASRGFRVEALPVATELDLVSLNSIQDLGCFL